MIDPASAFCIGVYFLGVGVVGSVLYIPLSLMKAIEHYHIGCDRRNNRRCFLDQRRLSSCRNGNDTSSRDTSSMFHDKPELLLIHKKKILRDILYDNNYLSNMDFDDKSDIYHHERLTSYISDFDKKLSERQPFSLHNGNVSRDVLSTTTPSERDDNESEIVIEYESAMLSLKYFKQFNKRKSISQSNLFVCSSTNSTSSLISSLDTSTSNSTNDDARRYQLEQRNDQLSEHSSLYIGTRQSSSSTLLGLFHHREFQQPTVIDEISAVHDILAL